MSSNKLYLYLGKRDKKGVKILAVLNGSEMPPTRIIDLKKLQLPADVHAEIESIVYQNRIEWEVWAESAPSYQILKDRMTNRGYVNLPIHTPVIVKSASSITNPIKANTQAFPLPAVMIQKAKPWQPNNGGSQRRQN